MEKNTQLPVEVVEQIKTNAALRCDRNEGKDNSSFMNGYYSGYVTGATAYAEKLHQLKAEFDAEMQKNYETIVAERAANHLTPGAPTTTGTYFGVLKSFAGDRDEMVVLHHQADKGVYYAYGQFSRPVKAEDIIGHVARDAHEDITRADYERKQAGMRWVRGTPKERKQYHAKVPGKIEDVIYDAIIWPTSDSDHWYAAGQGFNFTVRSNEIIEYLDEQPAAGREDDALRKEVIDFIRDIATNWDCDSDGHKYDTGCRKCEAKKLYKLFKQQKKK